MENTNIIYLKDGRKVTITGDVNFVEELENASFNKGNVIVKHLGVLIPKENISYIEVEEGSEPWE